MRYTALNPKPTLYRAILNEELNIKAARSYECDVEVIEARRKLDVYEMIRRIFQRHIDAQVGRIERA